ncbi:MAG: FGGY-family carbohydrate kinase [bacterium]
MILAVDLGSTSFKAALFDRRLKMVSQGRQRLIHRFASGGRVEIDAAQVLAALRGALAAARVSAYEIRVIALTSQAQTFTVVDHSGRPQLPFISWQDMRAGAECAILKRKLKGFGDHSSFGEILPALQICQLLRLAPGTGVMPLNLPSYVARLWTGVSVTDNNIAAMSGLYSLPLQAWWPAALHACGLREQQLPRLIPVGEQAAETTSAARRFGLPAGVPVVLAGNDQTAGGYAARLEERRSLLITLGTAQVAYSCCKSMPPPGPGVIRGPYPGGKFYRMGADGCGGNIVNWAETALAGCGDDSGFFSEAARAPQGSQGLVFDAALDAGSGSWRNLGLNHTRADLARSILEGLSRRMADLVRGLGVSVKGQRVLVAGGGSAQALWRKILAAELGAKLLVTDANPLLGAARMAVLAGG